MKRDREEAIRELMDAAEEVLRENAKHGNSFYGCNALARALDRLLLAAPGAVPASELLELLEKSRERCGAGPCEGDAREELALVRCNLDMTIKRHAQGGA